MKTIVMIAAVLGLVATGLCACASSPNMEGSPMQEGFSWVIDKQLAGMPVPGRSFPIEEDIRFLAEKKVSLLVSLTEEPAPVDELEKKGIELLHMPVEDFHPPKQDQIHQFVEVAAAEIESGGRVGVHCTAGKGRTGTLLATYLVYTGMTAQEAIDEVRRLRPGSIETVSQENAIIYYWQTLNGLI